MRLRKTANSWTALTSLGMKMVSKACCSCSGLMAAASQTTVAAEAVKRGEAAVLSGGALAGGDAGCHLVAARHLLAEVRQHVLPGLVPVPSAGRGAGPDRATAGQSNLSGVFLEVVREPRRTMCPFVNTISLTLTGTPSAKPFGFPRAQRASDSFAAARAESRSIRQYALTILLKVSIRAKASFVTSTGERALVA